MPDKVTSHAKILDTPDEIVQLAATLREQAAGVLPVPMIALDTEFIRETTFFPVMALIQVGTETDSWLVDPLALRPEELKPLFDVFQDPKILKILHAAQADQECLYTNYGVIAKPSFDTAMGASLSGYGDSIGLSKLIKDALNVQIQKGHARTDWTVRPIQDHLTKYAHVDVQFLLPLTKKLFAELDVTGRRQWALELSAKYEDERAYQPNPDGIARKLSKNGRLDRRAFATLRELLVWREKRVRDVDVPRRRIADDDVLMDLANVRPKDMQHLSAFRGLNRGELKHSGDAILAAVKRAAQIPDAELPDVPRPDTPDAREARAMELMSCFLKLLAENLQITARHLVTADELLPLLRNKYETVADVVKAGILSEGAARLIGEELLAISQGKRALSVRNGNVYVNKV